MKYVAKKSSTIKLGIKAGTAIAPQLLADSELSGLIMETRKQMNKQKKLNQTKGEQMKGGEKTRVIFAVQKSPSPDDLSSLTQ